ncbi:MAG: 1,2-phenylacetyl-CoA epoxidase subunit PaaC [Omnitrophica WOR_2 bacterium]
MKADLQAALAAQLLAMADDELILGHRDSEWCGHAPILEEDIAFANIALDEIGHASIWYSLLAELLGEDPQTYADRQVYFRDSRDFRNIQMVELANGDWAFSMLRQYLWDSSELVRLEALLTSAYTPVAEAADKIRKEELYHHRHTRLWIERLGQGTEESHRRLQQALNELWSYSLQIFEPLPGETLLVQNGYVPDPAQLKANWVEQILPAFETAGLEIPEPENQGRISPLQRDQHTPAFKILVTDMQSVARLEPDAEW